MFKYYVTFFSFLRALFSHQEMPLFLLPHGYHVSSRKVATSQGVMCFPVTLGPPKTFLAAPCIRKRYWVAQNEAKYDSVSILRMVAFADTVLNESGSTTDNRHPNCIIHIVIHFVKLFVSNCSAISRVLRVLGASQTFALTDGRHDIGPKQASPIIVDQFAARANVL